MELRCSQFENEGAIPVKYTCDGENVNPTLRIGDIPPGTKSMVLIMSDIDGKYGYWVHWLVYNIPVRDRIEQNSMPGTPGKNDYDEFTYRGPCDEEGTHHYLWELYALDTEITLKEHKTILEIEDAMMGHILANDELMSVYTHPQRKKV